MQKMPIKDPGFISALLEWINTHHPTLYGVLLSVVTAAIRIIYGGGSKRQLIVESVFCGAISLILASGLEQFGLSGDLAPFIGGVTGFLGVEKIREISDIFLHRKTKERRDDH